MAAVFYFLLIRPQQRRTRAQRELTASIAVGDDVVTIGGIHGTVRELDDDEAILEIADGVEVRFLRSAISRKLSYDEEAYEDEPEEEEEGAGEQS
jgi:preprotein translocase subunit YajC